MLEALKKRLLTHPDGALADCKLAVKQASTLSLADAMLRIEGELAGRLTPLARQARRCADELPLPKGIFVEAEDRQRAYTYFLDALPMLHRLTLSVKQSVMGYQQLRTIANTRERNAHHAKRHLCLLEVAMTETGVTKFSVAPLHEQLKQQNEHAAEFDFILTSHTDRLLRYCNETLNAFFIGCEKVADLQRHGRAADPSRAVLLLDGLARETDLFTDELMLAASAISERRTPI